MGIFDIFKKKTELDINVKITNNDDAIMEVYHKSSDIHKEALSRVDINSLSSIEPKNVTLVPKEILFLSYINGKKAQPLNVAGSWTYNYELDFQKVFTKLFQGKYLDFASPQRILLSQKIADLKELLKTHSLPSTGKKDILIKSILDNISEDEIKDKFPDLYFEITKAGELLLEQNDYIIYANKQGISINDIYNRKKAYPNHNKFELCLLELDSQSVAHFKEKDYGLFRNDFYNISLIEKDLGRRQEQLEALLKVCYLDLSGFGNNNSFDINSDFLAPGVLSDIRTLMDEFNIEMKHVKDVFESISFDMIPFPKQSLKNISFSKIEKELNL